MRMFILILSINQYNELLEKYNENESYPNIEN